MEKYKIDICDVTSNYFHFTASYNLKSIENIGLVPKIGRHAKYLEKTKKVFFVEGLDNLLILFDCWINIYYYMPTIPFIYTLGANFLRQKWFPQIIADCYFGVLKRTKIHERRSFKVFDKLLNESVLLRLDLEEKVDFDYNDIDEIKSRHYKKRHLELMGYNKNYSSLENNDMDRWNLHCLSNHIVSKDKIKLCYTNDSNSLNDVLKYAISNTKIDLEKIVPILYKYLKSRSYI